MEKKTWLVFLFLWSSSSFSEIVQEPLEFHAYFRAGAAVSQGLTEGVCYRLPGAPTEFSRFGNECGLYSEVYMSKAYQSMGGVQYKAHFTLAFSSDGNATWEDSAGTNDDLVVAHREAYVEAIGVLGEKGSIWAGKRFYNRYHLEMWDFFLLDQSGTGWGLERLSLGSGLIDVAMFRHFSHESDSPLNLTGDIRFHSIPLGAGRIGIAMIYGQLSEQGRETGQKKCIGVSGQQYTLDYKFRGRFWDYRTYVQYGLGLYGGRPELEYGHQTGSTIQVFNATSFDRSLDGQRAAQAWQNSSTIRWIHDIHYVPPDSAFQWNIALAWTRVDFGERLDESSEMIPVRDTLSAGVHPTWFLNEFWGIDADFYYTRIDNGLPRQNFDGSSGDIYIERTLGKATLGLVVRPDSIYQVKPQIRLYGTYADWNDAQQGDRLITDGSQVFEASSDGFTLGIQGEVWW
ncbi:MAG: carbohydrate porin [Oligoflexus sp.]